jgi:NADPH:quinone reductase-like Zn-dependent oxidoreductase
MAIASTSAGLIRAYELTELSINGLSIKEKPLQELKPFEIRVKVHAVSLNYRDLMMVKGAYNPRLPLPMTPCSDGAGEVVEVGAEVKKWKVGDRVMASFMPGWTSGRLTEAAGRSALGGGGVGMLAESVVLNEEGFVKIPDHLSYEEAATLPCAAVTAWHSLVEAGGLKPGQTVLTLGTGGVSIFAIQLALLTGAEVIATSSSNEKLERLKEMGVQKLINYKTTPNWSKEVLKMTDGVGVDHVVEVGGTGTLEQSMKSCAHAGRIGVIGVLAGGQGELNTRFILMKNLLIQGIFVGSREMFENMNAAISVHKLRPVVDTVFDFSDAQKAWQYLESGAHFGKVAIRLIK